MVPEDHPQQQHQNQRSSNSSSAGFGTRSCRKIKQKKIPQRGLGVAQLEKIRLEEQQKKEAAAGSSSCFLLPLPADVASPNSAFKAGAISIPNMEIFNPLPPSVPVSISPFLQRDINTKQAAASGPLAIVWNAKDFDHSLSHRDSVSPSGPINSKQLSQLQQLSPLVNGSSPSSSSGVNLQMEPPSNQSYCSNSNPLWLEKERMVGLKRPWPFAVVEQPPGSLTSYLRNLPTLGASNRLGELGGVPDSFKFNASSSTIFRDGPGPSQNSDKQEDPIPSKYPRHDECEAVNGDILSLAPPTRLISQFKQPIAYRDFDLFRNQGSMEEELLYRTDGSRVAEPLQRPFYSFLPAGPSSNAAAASSDKRCDGDESVDLSLNL